MENKQPKILHILYSGLGGHGNVFFSLVKADKKKEFLFEAIFCGIEPLRKEYAVECENGNIDYSYIPKKKGLDLNSYWKILKTLFKSKPEIVFLHGSSFILPALIYKIKNQKKIIVRDTQAHHLKSKMEWIWLSMVLVVVDKIIFLTKEAADLIKIKFKLIFNDKKVVTIGNGIDVHQYQVKKSNKSNSYVFGMQSRFQKIKDHKTLIKAFCRFKNSSKKPLLLHLAGEGETLEELKQLSKDLNCENEVSFKGILDQDELKDFMLDLDVYVHASYGESMSTAIMQAMACGLPIIASDVFGINNMIDSSTGVLVPVNDVESLKNAMEDLISNEEKQKAIGEKARHIALTNFSHERMFENYKKNFKAVLER